MSKFACVVALGVVGVAAWFNFAERASGQVNNPAANSAPRTSTSIEPVLVEECLIHLLDTWVASSQRTGVLDSLEPKEGDLVKKDQLVAKLFDDVAVASLAVAKEEATNDVEIKFAKASRDVAATEYEKGLETNKRVKGAIPEIELERLRLQVVKAALQIEQAQHQLKIAGLKAKENETTLKLFKVTSPIDGMVQRVYKQRGESVREGDPILEIVNTSRVKVEGQVRIEHLTRIRRGCPVKVRLDLNDVQFADEELEFDGRIEFVDPTSESIKLTTRVWAEVANKNNVLRAGLTARMLITPASAIAREPDPRATKAR